MAPVRRYLRITKHWVIEVRIYSEPPSIADSWLLRRADPAITRVMQAVRPMVMPKLREERERAAKKGKAARKVVKETIVGGENAKFFRLLLSQFLTTIGGICRMWLIFVVSITFPFRGL